MCGLYGWIRHPQSTAPVGAMMTLTRVLCMLNETRGDDGTGLAFPTSEGIKIVKEPIPATQFLMGEKHWEGLRTLPLWCLGHTRAATVGAHTQENTHPFMMGELVGTHNGSVTNHAELPVDKTRYTLPDCDSAALFALMDQMGPLDALKHAKGGINLAFSIPPYDAVVLHQEWEKSLSIVYHQPWKMMLWSSGVEHLLAALAVVGQLPCQENHGREGVTLIQTEPGKLLTVKADTLGEEQLHWDRAHVIRPSYAVNQSGYATRSCDADETLYPGEDDFGYFQDGARWWEHHNLDGTPRQTPKGSETAYPNMSSSPIKGGHRSITDINSWHGGRQRACRYCEKTPAAINTRYQVDIPKGTTDAGPKKSKTLYFHGPALLIYCPSCKASGLDRSMLGAPKYPYLYHCKLCQAKTLEIGTIGKAIIHPAPRRVLGLPGGNDASAAV